VRYIPIFETEKEPDEAWLNKARELTKALENEPDVEKRKKLIKDNKAHWGELKEWLLKFSEGKCWYSEAKDCVQYWEVEHFRPKNAAKDEDGTEINSGYWWLAFDWHNYRIAGQTINRKKGSYFPLKPGTYVADRPGTPCEDETPCLLDPADENDCRLVFFDVTGNVIAKPGANEWEQHRVEISCDRYNLNYQTLVDCRKTLWQTCWASINEYLNLMKAHCETNSITKRGAAGEVLKRLRLLVRSDAPFSMVAVCCVIASNEAAVIKAVLTGK
jgi:uncharacterized protein (TIGR02646 family)